MILAVANDLSVVSTTLNEILEFVPDEVKEFYADLTDEDKTVLKELAAKHETFENEDQALEALKEVFYSFLNHNKKSLEKPKTFRKSQQIARFG